MRVLVAAILVCCLVWTSEASAADEVRFGQTMGTLYLSASPTEYQPNQTGVSLFTPFTVYLVPDIDYADIGHPELNAGTGMQAYEVGVEFPAELTLISAIIRNSSTSPGGGTTNLIVELSPTILAAQTPIDLVEFSLGAFSDTIDLTDMCLELHASAPSSFDPAAPGFNDSSDALECHTADGSPIQCLRAFEYVRPMGINCRRQCCWTIDPVEESSWSTLKADFER